VGSTRREAHTVAAPARAGGHARTSVCRLNGTVRRWDSRPGLHLAGRCRRLEMDRPERLNGVTLIRDVWHVLAGASRAEGVQHAAQHLRQRTRLARRSGTRKQAAVFPNLVEDSFSEVRALHLRVAL